MLAVTEVQEEGKNAIESPTSPMLPDIGPEGYLLGKTHIYMCMLKDIVVVRGKQKLCRYAGFLMRYVPVSPK